MSYSISISYPPLDSPNGSPFLSQNRQFQWTNTGNNIYPVVPAYAATLLSKNNYQVFWDDAIAQKLSFQQWLSRIIKLHPDLIAIETKTPVIKKHWQITKILKNNLPKSKIVLFGDHPTALPQESLKNSAVDHILSGGDYDFLLLKLANLLSSKSQAPKIIKTSDVNLADLPLIDRKLTQWHLYAYNNSNYKYTPGAYIMSGRDCWWGKCTFCSWTTIYPPSCYHRLTVAQTIAEIKNLVSLGVKEIFDDSGTLPVGDWLTDLCHQLIDTGLNKKVRLSCNLRFGALNQTQYQLLGKAGFRFILYGMESANPDTIKRINKNIDIQKIPAELSWAKQAGLQPHITVMIGYPWETVDDAHRTLNLARQLFKEGLIDSLQATRIIPYPGTPLFSQCQNQHLLLTTNWDDYDMRSPVIKSSINASTQSQLIKNLFKGVLTPKFLITKILSIRSKEDIRFFATYAVKFIKKLQDF